MDYTQSVTSFPSRQYKTGETAPGGHVAEDVYAQALDHLVIACVDIVVLCRGKMLIGKRAWEPHPDWWMIGGRMRKGELYGDAARRNVRRELGLEIDAYRFSYLGTYNMIFDTRAQEPKSGGCHMLSVTMAVEIDDNEVHTLKMNEEYLDHRWIDPREIALHSDAYHPCLVQVATDILSRAQK